MTDYFGGKLELFIQEAVHKLHKTSVRMKLIIVMSLPVVAVPHTPAQADFFKEITKPIKKTGKELNRFRRRVQAEGNRFVDRVNAEAKRAEARAKKVEREIRRIRDQAKEKITKLPVIGHLINEILEEVEELAENTADVLEENATLITRADHILKGNIDEVNITLFSVSEVLGKKIADNISNEKLEEFLSKELIGDLTIMHAIMPLQSFNEVIDITGMTKCVREGSQKKVVDGAAYLLGAPGKVFQSVEALELNLEAAGTQIALQCVQKKLMRSKGEQEQFESDEVITEVEAQKRDAEQKRDAAVASIEANEKLKQEQEEYVQKLREKYNKEKENFEKLKALKEENKKIEEAAKKNREELTDLLKNIDPEIGAEVEKI